MNANDIVVENLKGTIKNQSDLIVERGQKIKELEAELDELKFRILTDSCSRECHAKRCSLENCPSMKGE